jgi:hypothetical protein
MEGADMHRMRMAFCVFILLIFVAAGCSRSSREVTEIRSFPLDSLDGIITQSGAELDKENSSDGRGSLRIVTIEPTVVRLFETGDVDVENARILYEAKVRSEGVDGPVYLEMWCHFPGKGEFFSRNSQAALSGTSNWTSMSTPFFLKKGENPDNIKLNLVIEGKGTVWIDDIRLVKGPLEFK